MALRTGFRAALAPCKVALQSAPEPSGVSRVPPGGGALLLDGGLKVPYIEGMNNKTKTTKRNQLITDVVVSMGTCLSATTRDSYIDGGLFNDALEVVTGRSQWAESYVAGLDAGNSRGKFVGWTRFKNEVTRQVRRDRNALIGLARHEAEIDEICALIGETAKRAAVVDAVRFYGFHVVRGNVLKARS